MKKELEYPLFLFNEGTNYKAYESLGAHSHITDGVRGYYFAVWAPSAKSVSVVGDFNDWNPQSHFLSLVGKSGVWYTFIPGVGEGCRYKFCVTPKHGPEVYKSDPFAFFSELRPQTASITYNTDGFLWSDEDWQTKKGKKNPIDGPIVIYEIHLCSWRRTVGGELYNYRELADILIPYLLKMGYTHIELMPVTEYPFDGSWGYQVTGYFAITSRMGEPDDFAYFVNQMHAAGIGVIVDWVPAHFPKDAHGLRRFDGTALFEYEDSRKGEHFEWGTLVFNYGRGEVISFLMSSAFFLIDKYHIDGLRMDAVSSMLYLSYGRDNGEWLPNRYGGRENLEAIDLIKKVNKTIIEEFPGTLMIAEESTAWPLVTRPTDIGGLGFSLKWNMGWMNDTLRYVSMDPIFRKYNHDMVTFSMVYAFSENYILPLSHDEVVHGKRSLLDRMPGTYDQKFLALRSYLCYYMAHPGKKLFFMGGEIGQFNEWNFAKELDWNLLEFTNHKDLQNFVAALNKFYVQESALWQTDDSWDGFKWINETDGDKSVLSFIRLGKKKYDYVVVVSNFTPVERKNYTLGVLSRGDYEVVFASGGNEVQKMVAKKVNYRNFPYTITADLPPLSTLFIKRTTTKKKTKGE